MPAGQRAGGHGQEPRLAGRPHLAAVGDLVIDTVVRVDPAVCMRLGVARGTAAFRSEAEVEGAAAGLGGGSVMAGGSAANTCVAFAAAGGRASMLATLPEDDAARSIRDDLRTRGVLLPLPASPSATTGKCLVLLMPDGERAFLIWQGPPRRLRILRECIEAWFAGAPSCDGVLAEGYLLATAAGDGVVRLALSRAGDLRAARILSLSDRRLVAENRRRFQAVLNGGVDVVLGTESEFAALSDTGSARCAAEEQSRQGGLAVVTMGNRGAMVHTSEGRCLIGAKSVEAASAVGAGDAFAGGFLFGMLSGFPHAECLALGSARADPVLRVHQARLPLLDH
jgi:sugar/nucleoside kinase (ribokinase family)